jgi:hypothetical protein
MPVPSQATREQVLPSEAMEPVTTNRPPFHNCSPDQWPREGIHGEVLDDAVSLQDHVPTEVTGPMMVYFTANHVDAFSDALIDAPTSSGESSLHKKPLTSLTELQVSGFQSDLHEQAAPSAAINVDPDNEGPSFGQAWGFVTVRQEVSTTIVSWDFADLIFPVPITPRDERHESDSDTGTSRVTFEDLRRMSQAETTRWYRW